MDSKEERLERVRNLIIKINEVFRQQPELLHAYYGQGKNTIYSFACQAGNHLFDDCPEKFGITKWEGHVIRGYFQQNIPEGKETSEIHDLFPEG